MTKTDLVEKVANGIDITKKDAQSAVDAVLESIIHSLARGDEVRLIGFGTFKVRRRSERVGRNPQSGEELRIPAKKVPAFKSGKQLKDAVANS